MQLANKTHKLCCICSKNKSGLSNHQRDRTRRVNTRCHRWLCPWSGSYLAALCGYVEAMSGRVTANGHWVTEHWSFRGAYRIEKQRGGRVKLFSLKNVPMGKGAEWQFLGNKDVRRSHRKWVQKARVERRRD